MRRYQTFVDIKHTPTHTAYGRKVINELIFISEMEWLALVQSENTLAAYTRNRQRIDKLFRDSFIREMENVYNARSLANIGNDRKMTGKEGIIKHIKLHTMPWIMDYRSQFHNFDKKKNNKEKEQKAKS
jgi:hypothetical protein